MPGTPAWQQHLRRGVGCVSVAHNMTVPWGGRARNVPVASGSNCGVKVAGAWDLNTNRGA